MSVEFIDDESSENIIEGAKTNQTKQFMNKILDVNKSWGTDLPVLV